jgi:hypothetical protein
MDLYYCEKLPLKTQVILEPLKVHMAEVRSSNLLEPIKLFFICILEFKV